VALLGGASFVRLLDLFPTPILGAMLVFSGIELASAGLRGVYAVAADAPVAEAKAAREASLVCLATAGFVVGMGTGVGALAGLTVAAVQKARDVAESRLGTGDFKGRGWQRASAGAGGIADAGVGSAEALSDEAGPREDATIVSILRSQEPIGRRRQ